MDKKLGLSSTEVKELSVSIINTLIKHVDWQSIKHLHVYLPIEQKNEVDTWLLINHIRKNYPQTKIYVPKASGYARLIEGVKLKTSSFGNLEPEQEKIIHVKHFDLIIVPTIGFDCHGWRLGYGKGYYDKFLVEQSHTQSVGLAYSFCEIKPRLPRESHDRQLDTIITER